MKSRVKTCAKTVYKSRLSREFRIRQRSSKTTVLELPTMTFHHDGCNQIRVDCYILLRQAVKNKKAPINIQNEDKKWFKKCTLSHLLQMYEKKTSQRQSVQSVRDEKTCTICTIGKKRIQPRNLAQWKEIEEKRQVNGKGSICYNRGWEP